MNILYINYGAPPSRGGIIRYLHSTARELAAMGHCVKVIAAEWGKRAQEHRPVDGVDYLVVPAWNRPRDTGDLRALVARGAVPSFFAQQKQPDVVHVHSMMGFSINDLDIFFEAGLPVVFTLSNYYYMCPHLECFIASQRRVCSGPAPSVCAACNPGTVEDDWRLYQDASRKILSSASKIIAISEYVLESYLQFGVPRSLFQRIPLVSAGCDIMRARRPHMPGECVRFGFFTTLAPHKGAHEAIMAFKMLPGDAQACLNIWGRGKPDYEHELRLLAGNELDKRIFLKGAYELSDFPDMFGQMDVALAPVLWQEAQGMVVQEALAAGIPVIASDMGGIRDWVRDGVNGRLVKCDEDFAESLASALLEVVRRPGIIGEWRRNIPPMPSVKGHAIELLDLYGRIINGAASVCAPGVPV